MDPCYPRHYHGRYLPHHCNCKFVTVFSLHILHHIIGISHHLIISSSFHQSYHTSTLHTHCFNSSDMKCTGSRNQSRCQVMRHRAPQVAERRHPLHAISGHFPFLDSHYRHGSCWRWLCSPPPVGKALPHEQSYLRLPATRISHLHRFCNFWCFKIYSTDFQPRGISHTPSSQG